RELRSQSVTPPTVPTIHKPWRTLAKEGVAYSLWPLEEKQAAQMDRQSANRRMFSDQTKKDELHEWLQNRAADNELWRLQHPYLEDMRDFFERSTFLRIEASDNPVPHGRPVTLKVYVGLPT